MKSKYFTADVNSTLEKCLQGDVEELCDSCKTVQRIKYDTLVMNAPDTLYLCAVRYNYISGNAYKIKKNIHPSDIVEISGVKYKLRSIIVHDGETVNSGHYYTLLPDPADPLIFHKLDDERISKIKILDHKGDGYIFTYVKLTDVSLHPQKHSKLPSYSEVLSRVQPDNSKASKCRSIPSLSKEIPILKGNKRNSAQIFQDSSCKSYQYEHLTQPDMKIKGKIHPKKKQTTRSYKVSDDLSGEENIRSNKCFKDDICSAGISRLSKDINLLPVLQKIKKVKNSNCDD